MRTLLTTLLMTGLAFGATGCDDLEEVFEDLDLDITIVDPRPRGYDYVVEDTYYEESYVETEVIVEEVYTPGGYVVEEVYYY